MLLFDVTFDTGEESKIGQKHRTWLKIIVVVKQNIVQIWRTSGEIILYFKRQIALRIGNF